MTQLSVHFELSRALESEMVPRLERHWRIMLPNLEPNPIRRAAITRIDQLAAEIAGGTLRSEDAQALVDFLEIDRVPAFWASNLGQRLFGLGASGQFPEGADKVEARFILGVSRQRVDELIKEGKLPFAGDPPLISWDALRERWRELVAPVALAE